jgi:hypothetical protein
VTSQKSGFHFPRATSRQFHEGPRVYITTFWRNKYIRWNRNFKKSAMRATSTTIVALLISRVDNISATQT